MPRSLIPRPVRRHVHRIRHASAVACLALAAYLALTGGATQTQGANPKPPALLATDQRAVVISVIGSDVSRLVHSGDRVDLYDATKASTSDYDINPAPSTEQRPHDSRLIVSNVRVLTVLQSDDSAGTTSILVGVASPSAGQLAAFGAGPMFLALHTYP